MSSLLFTARRFRKVPQEDALRVVRHMLLTNYPLGKEWDPMSEQQIYFVKQGKREAGCNPFNQS